MIRTALMLFVLTLIAGFAHAADAGNFQLHVANNNGHVPASAVYDGLGCTGDNVAPAVHWSDAPEGTRSYALTVFDPDAPTGTGWWHWIVVDIPASITSLPTGGELPPGARAMRNDYGKVGWGGPCPPADDKPHHYEFTLFALDVPTLNLPAGATAAMARFMIHKHAIGKAQVTLTYGR